MAGINAGVHMIPQNAPCRNAVALFQGVEQLHDVFQLSA